MQDLATIIRMTKNVINKTRKEIPKVLKERPGFAEAAPTLKSVTRANPSEDVEIIDSVRVSSPDASTSSAGNSQLIYLAKPEQPKAKLPKGLASCEAPAIASASTVAHVSTPRSISHHHILILICLNSSRTQQDHKKVSQAKNFCWAGGRSVWQVQTTRVRISIGEGG